MPAVGHQTGLTQEGMFWGWMGVGETGVAFASRKCVGRRRCLRTATWDHEGQGMMALALRPGCGAAAKPCLPDRPAVSLVTGQGSF